MIPPPPRSPLFPYPTLFRSVGRAATVEVAVLLQERERIDRPVGAPRRHDVQMGEHEDRPERHATTRRAWRPVAGDEVAVPRVGDRKSTRLNSSHLVISYAGF